MAELTCGVCRKFSLSGCPPRCLPNHNAYAQSESAACAYFHRVSDVRLEEYQRDLVLGRRHGDGHAQA